MNILIIGINGFIGSCLAEYLVKKKHRVLGTVHNKNNTWRIQEFIHSIDIINCKINEIKSHEQTIKDFDPEVVIHCGWYGSNSQLLLDDAKQFSENIPGLISMFDIIKKCRVNCFIGIGAGWEYGKYKNKAVETQTPEPINAYGSAKYVACQISEQLCKIYNIRFLWVRPFWIYGHKDYEKRFIPCIINKCLKNEKIELNSCNHLVNYLFIDDFVMGVDILMENNHNGIYNFSGNYSYNVKKNIIEKIKELTNSKSNITYNKPYPDNFIYNLDGENNKLLKTGWKPIININDGLERTVNFYKKIISK